MEALLAPHPPLKTQSFRPEADLRAKLENGAPALAAQVVSAWRVGCLVGTWGPRATESLALEVRARPGSKAKRARSVLIEFASRKAIRAEGSDKRFRGSSKGQGQG